MTLCYGECDTIADAVEFIHFKQFDGWHVMCAPFRVIDGAGWGFLLYKLEE